MYSFTTRSKKAEKQFYEVIKQRKGIKEKLQELQKDPHKKLDAHKLKGKLAGKWSCYLGGDIRLVYEIDNEKKEIIVCAAGSHKQSYT
ncbi:hypothetical protein CMO92_03170 [Candidatus Woesearchaeota archaeon]|nr:hypothetical protein [Candidatus Woesearchaeota archaeon]|tara:strand:- start:296 stop:559 length:264 start_codon:yes stop_codon:yes gene_type:complete